MGPHRVRPPPSSLNPVPLPGDTRRAHLVELAGGLGAHPFLEFRTGEDRGAQHLLGDDHHRAYLDPETVVAEIEERGDTLTTLEQGHGLAVYKSEDPHVARIVATFGS